MPRYCTAASRNNFADYTLWVGMDRLVVSYAEINTVIFWWSCVWVSVVDAVGFVVGR